MLNPGIEEINKLNKDFYQKHAESFDNSRKDNFWKGFETCLNFIKPDTKILDLGCGNARFYDFLLKNNLNPDYYGVDSSEEFIKSNQEKYPNAKFGVKDLVENIDDLKEKYDFVSVFGVTHHIPSVEYRKYWFEKLGNLVSENGYIILSFWNFDTQKSNQNFKTKFYQIEEGDYFLGWKGDFEQLRFCHLFSKKELLVLSTIKIILPINCNKGVVPRFSP